MAKKQSKKSPSKAEQPFFVKHKHMRWLLPLLIILFVILLLTHHRMDRYNNDYSYNQTPMQADYDPADGSLEFKSPIVNGLGYTLRYPSNWTAYVSSEKISTPAELAYEFKTKDDAGIVHIKHVISESSSTEIKQIADTALKNGAQVSKETNNNNLEITEIYEGVSDKTTYSAYIISPKGYYVIQTSDDSRSHRGIAFAYFLAGFNLVK